MEKVAAILIKRIDFDFGELFDNKKCDQNKK